MNMLKKTAPNIMMMTCMCIIIIPPQQIPILIICIMMIRFGIITRIFTLVMIGTTHDGIDPSGTDRGGAGLMAI
jgi:hypothetical protein